VVAIVRRALRTRRVGHAGTLDPDATGLLIVLVGAGTRLARYLVGLTKEYEGAIRLGAVTDTDDATGVVVRRSDAWTSLSEARIAEAMAALTGDYLQVPPSYSAKRTGGERAHRLARRGAPVRLTPEPVHVHSFSLDGRHEGDVRFRASVSSGTYVRSLARDLGERLGCGAHLLRLRRLAVGPFSVADGISLESVRGGAVELLPLRRALPHVVQVEIDPTQYARVTHGQPLEAAGGVSDRAALLLAGELVAVARAEDGRWQPEVVLVS
jgi:tRNA pseudouridine55 synthase